MVKSSGAIANSDSLCSVNVRNHQKLFSAGRLDAYTKASHDIGIVLPVWLLP